MFSALYRNLRCGRNICGGGQAASSLLFGKQPWCIKLNHTAPKPVPDFGNYLEYEDYEVHEVHQVQSMDQLPEEVLQKQRARKAQLPSAASLESLLGKIEFYQSNVCRSMASCTPKADVGRADGCGGSGIGDQKPKKLIPLKEARRFMLDCFASAEVPADNATAMADMLLQSDHQGNIAHGMIRMVMYMYDLCRKACDGSALPCVLSETDGTAWVDGRNGLGAVVGNFCMDLAVRKAKAVGFGLVSCKNSNHYGIAGWYARRAIREGVIGITMSNGSPLMAPTRAKEPAVGTNPIAVGVPAGKDDSFLLDISFSGTTLAQLEIIRLLEGKLRDETAIGPDGEVCTDAEVVYSEGALLPLGGLEKTSGHNGYGLACMADVLSGVMTGANYLTKIRPWHKAPNDDPANLGQVFMAIDQKFFTEDFDERIKDFLRLLRTSEPTNPELPVLVAGDKERALMKKVDEIGGIEYPEEVLEIFAILAERLNVSQLKPIESQPDGKAK